MNFKLISILLFFMFVSYLGWSQVPETIIATNIGSPGDGASRRGCTEQFAGTIRFVKDSFFFGESNDVENETKYFCFNDIFDLKHNGDADLTGDPQPSTDAGIGYAWYAKKPTISGPDLTTIRTDPDRWLIPTPPNDIWLYTDELNGDARFSNRRDVSNGSGQFVTLPELINNGEPVEVWFAPITYDALVGSDAHFEQVTLNDPSGPCVNVNLDQAFSVVYLTEIVASDRSNTATTGTFKIDGGLPQWDNGTNYNISIEFIGDPSVTGTVIGNPNHGSIVNYTLPKLGSYLITITDGKSCDEHYKIRASDGNPLFGLDVGDEVGDEGDIICVPITTNMGFEDLIAFQMGLYFDPTVLEFVEVKIAGIPKTLHSFTEPMINNAVGLIWIQDFTVIPPTPPITIPDGNIIFEACFRAIGNPGECSNILLGDLPSTSPAEITQEYSGGDSQSFLGDFIQLGDGSICINTKGLHGVVSDVHGNCGSTSQGSFTINIREGEAPYSFSWQTCGSAIVNGPTVGNADLYMVNNLAAGDYCYTITDNASPAGEFIGMITLVDGPSLGATLDPTPPSCKGKSDGIFCVEDIIADGVTVTDVSPFDFEWSNSATTQCINLIPSGSYEVTVTHSLSGCSTVSKQFLTEPAGMNVDNITEADPICPGNEDGQIAISISGGIMPYQFNWSDTGIGGQVHPGLGAGTYIVTITDGDNCQEIIDTFELMDPPSIRSDFSALTDVSCFNGVPCDGGATVVVSGGDIGVFDITWESGEVSVGVTTSTATQLCQGTQFITVTDGICAVQDTLEIGFPAQLFVDMAVTSSKQVSCNGDSDGEAIVGGMGGNNPYTYVWNLNGSSATGPSVSGLEAGSYQVIITDAAGCNIVTSIVVGEPDSLIAFVDLAHTKDVSCGGDTDGQISVAWSGGNTGSATYDITGGGAPSDISVFTELSPGNYTITVTDVKGCTDTTTHIIQEPAPVVANILPPEEPQCAGYRTLITVDGVTGGQGPGYTYSIDNGPALDISTPIPVFAGEHSIFVYDEKGCEFDTLISITEPLPVSVTLPQEMTLELGENDILIANFVSGFDLDSVTWTPTDYLTCGGDSVNINCLNPNISPLESTLYTITTTDINGCIATAEIFVRVDKDRNVFIPNVFTPNGDGTNDLFTPLVSNGVTNVKFMKIYDRWGEKVYEQHDYLPLNTFGTGWDGSFRGKPAESGVYIYLIEVEFLDGISLLYRGDVTLLSREK